MGQSGSEWIRVGESGLKWVGMSEMKLRENEWEWVAAKFDYAHT